ncbi:bifunctional glycosyltransferase/CDP-glycerol:glycerophosphate glycerophosphotransferase [Lactococcus formosensis]|uniref:bifunctional glycosyltransferase/CDP-glycerol:glycerophosphate glycerophosphotransferase n=1 Tax=Lactococcus formosensis TaxID=1281486 RepID=UPI0024353604|nr:CDP-glycerol glycerophosphotransferase family protein [Lactococcus formosensis]
MDLTSVYNVEEYLDDAMCSLENQLLDFTKNVQVVLVNDGSTDNSLKKVKEWQRRYPNNIIAIDKKNGGVSSARNAGIEVARGKYINFLDPDDMLDEGVLLQVRLFFQKNPDIKIAHIPLYLFEAKSEPHILNKVFEKDIEIVDIRKNHTKIFAHISSSFFSRELFEDEIFRFEVGRKYGEDLALVAKLVEQEKKFGLINNVFYRYRARNSGDSAMDSSRKDPETYIPNAEMMLELIKMHEKDGEIDLWLQNIIMYDLAWKVRREELPFVAPENFYKIYFDLVYDILQYINVSVIRSVGHLRWVQKEELIYLKNSGKLSKENEPKGMLIHSGAGVSLVNDDKKYILSNVISKIHIIKYRPETNTLNIVGSIDHIFGIKDFKVLLCSKDVIFESMRIEEPSRIQMIGVPIHSVNTFSFDIPIDNLKSVDKLELKIGYKTHIQKLKLEFSGLLVSIGNGIKVNYLWTPQKLISYNFNENKFEIKNNSLNNLITSEKLLIDKILSTKGIPEERKKYLINLRKLSLKSRLSENVINIFQDRENRADDNAEVFYKYVQDKHPEWDNYFVLDSNSSDWQRLTKEGFRLIEYGSIKHEKLLIQAQNLISSQANLSVMRPWDKNFGFLRDSYHYNFIFLQHGVTKHDLSLWLRKIEKDIRMLVTVSNLEADGFLGYGYEYSESEITNTGFPRFDRYNIDFYSEKNKGNIVLAPTWRNGIWNDNDSIDIKIKKLHSTTFYKMWQELIFSNILKEISLKGNTISFLPHPLLREIENGFEFPDYIKVIPFEERYIDVLTNTDMLLTDFSSIYFDIAYQGKPTLYFQFDAGNVNNKEGYFDFEEMGFGPVCSDIDTVGLELVNIIRRKFKMEDIYIERVKQFFTYTDTNNSLRLLERMETLIYDSIANNEKFINSYSGGEIDRSFEIMLRKTRKNFSFKEFIKMALPKDSKLYKTVRKIYRRFK